MYGVIGNLSYLKATIVESEFSRSETISVADDKIEELLSPSFREEATDRVIQWTWWSSSALNPIKGLPEFEWRYNVTQGGNFSGRFTPTQIVERLPMVESGLNLPTVQALLKKFV